MIYIKHIQNLHNQFKAVYPKLRQEYPLKNKQGIPSLALSRNILYDVSLCEKKVNLKRLKKQIKLLFLKLLKRS